MVVREGGKFPCHWGYREAVRRDGGTPAVGGTQVVHCRLVLLRVAPFDARSMTSDFYCDEVLNGKTPVQVVAETAQVLAYHHTRPFWPVHIVVIPKQHVPSLTDLGAADEDLLHQLLAVVREVAARVEREHGAARVLTNLGRYQDSKHLHFHVNSGEPLR